MRDAEHFKNEIEKTVLLSAVFFIYVYKILTFLSFIFNMKLLCYA